MFLFFKYVVFGGVSIKFSLLVCWMSERLSDYQQYILIMWKLKTNVNFSCALYNHRGSWSPHFRSVLGITGSFSYPDGLQMDFWKHQRGPTPSRLEQTTHKHCFFPHELEVWMDIMFVIYIYNHIWLYMYIYILHPQHMFQSPSGALATNTPG